MLPLTQSHEKKIASIRRRLASEIEGEKKSSSHMTRRINKKKRSLTPYLKELNEILLFNPSDRSIWVESGVTMDQLVKWCLPRRLLPPVVPEFKQITVGGAITGGALESSSFRFGQFNDPCLVYEVLFPHGDVLFASPENNRDLFYGLAGSYGTTGGISAAKIPLLPCKDLVLLECHVVEGVEELQDFFDDAASRDRPPDFLEAILLAENQIIVMEGKQIYTGQQPKDAIPLSFRMPWSKWFVHHVVDQAKKKRWAFVMSLYDYLFRFDRGAFWMGQFITAKTMARFLFEYRLGTSTLPQFLHDAYAAEPPSLRPNLGMRLLTGWKMSSASMYRVIHSLPEQSLRETFFVHDFYIPLSTLGSFLEFVQKEAGIFPLWLCPLRGTSTEQFLSPHYMQESTPRTPKPDFINVGIYGIPRDVEAIPEITHEIEKKAHLLGGRAMLYSAHEYSETLFWEIYDKKRYEALRKKYGMDENPDLFQKM